MSRPTTDMVELWGPDGRGPRNATALLDTGATHTIISRDDAEEAGVRCTGPGEFSVPMGGRQIPVCRRRMTVGIAETDCKVDMDVLVARKPVPGRFGNILGADFMQRAGMMLDLRRGDHSLHCDIRRKDKSDPLPENRKVRERGLPWK